MLQTATEAVNTEYRLILDGLVKQLQKRQLVLFLGAGMSEGASLRGTNQLLTRKALARKLTEALLETGLEKHIGELCDNCIQTVSTSIDTCCDNRCGGRDGIVNALKSSMDALYSRIMDDMGRVAGADLEEVALKYQAARDRNALIQFLRDELQDAQPKPIHEKLLGLPFKAIYTTNYDRLVEIAEKGAHRLEVISDDERFVEVYRPDELREGGRIPYFKLHGSIEAKEVVITIEDRLKRHLSVRDSALFRELQRDIGFRTALFIGYGLMDTDLMEVIYSTFFERLPKADPKVSYAVVENPTSFLRDYWIRSFKIHVLEHNSDAFFEDLVQAYKAASRGPGRRLIAIEKRQPAAWQAFVDTLEAKSFGGMVLYGQTGEVAAIPIDLFERCRLRQNVVSVFLNLAEIGASAWIGNERFTSLFGEIASQIDSQLPNADIVRRLKAREGNWALEAEDKTNLYWQNRIGEEDPHELQRILSGKRMPEEQQEHLQEYERHFAAAVSDTFFPPLKKALEGRRLMVFITDFDEIERDEGLFLLLTQSLFVPLARDLKNVGLVISRRSTEELQFDPNVSTYALKLLQQVPVKDNQGGQHVS